MAKLLTSPDRPRDPQDPNQFRLAAWIDTAPFEDLLDVTIDAAAGGRASLSMPFLLKHSQGGGVMHGGALTALADTAVAMAIKTLLPEGSVFATTELSMRFLAPVKEGTVYAEAEVFGPCERTFRGKACLRDAQGMEVAHLIATFRLSRRQPEER